MYRAKRLVCLWAVFTGLLIFGVYAADDPFAKPPAKAAPNCGQEYRLKYDVQINSVDEFIAFLKNHQSKEASFDNPQQDNFVPLELPEYNFTLELDKLKDKVRTIEVTNIFASNKIVYELALGGFCATGPWDIVIRMSNNGDVSIRHCAGK